MPRTPDQNKEIKDKRRVQMMNVGLRLFGSLPYKEVKVDTIAKTLRVSHGLFFHYFAGKDDLFTAVWKESVLPFAGLPNYAEALRLGGSAGLEKLCNDFEKVRKMEIKDQQKVKIYVLYPQDEAVAKAFPKLIKGHLLRAVLTKLIKAGQEEGKIIAGPASEIGEAGVLLFSALVSNPESLHGDLIYNLLTKGLS